ncbi:MAG: demethoxyubiquinone hydroxylase family protein [Rhodospirillaceae bacterium]|jgi:ubiquinone biosynthesis monooxygenase Coq7|nr:demethoxyubiquinone hydroxylase family protein [Rhodospirillaceae bacterium]|tara:strand:- start:2993 stop:3592 length:600 start_codon:yes stop_codon:yes gene_type:complete
MSKAKKTKKPKTNKPKAKKPKRLPGDPSKAEMIERMIRVDQAGEYGAVRIYEGQLSVLGRSACGRAIERMAEQERRHLDAFNKLIPERRVRPTALLPLWHAAGFALGAGTALLGEKAAHACTAAVEEVIDEHYAGQVARLDAEGGEKKLRDRLDEFRLEEAGHKQTSLDLGAREAPGYEALTGLIRAGSRLAIWLSTRI